MKTLGIDLSANTAKTGACAVDWEAGTIALLPRPTSDDDLVEAIQQADFVGVDVPLGWPDGFVEALAAHRDGLDWPVIEADPPLDRVPLTYRATDLVAISQGHRPLSVSADRLGIAAMRGARLQTLLRQRGVPVDRSGLSGKIAEVYPAGALRRWELSASGYKGRANAMACAALAASVCNQLGHLADAAVTALAGCDDDGLDAFVCAVMARAVVLGHTTRPSPDQVPIARREGWIHLPSASLSAIVE